MAVKDSNIIELTVVSLGKPVSANAYRNWHWGRRAAYTKKWRAESARMLNQSGAANEPLTCATVTVTPTQKNRSAIADVAACYPAAKAVIDGAVDANVLPDDTPEHVTAVTFLPAQITGTDGLKILIEGELL